MQERRLIISLSVAILLPFVILGLLLPTPSSALTLNPNNPENLYIGSADCVAGPEVYLDRNPNNNDQGSGFDYYRVIIKDSTGNVDLIEQRKSTWLGAPGGRPGIFMTPIVPFTTTPAGTYITAQLYDQGTPDASEPNGPLLGSTAPFPLVCGGTPNASSLGVAYYPPDVRVMATVRVNTSVYSDSNSASNVVATLTAGQTWFVSTTDSTGKFNQIFLGGPNLGWVKASDIALQGTLPAPASTTTGGTAPSVTANNPAFGSGTILAFNLRIHSTADLNSPQIGVAHGGDAYQVTSQQGNWLNVSGPGGTGWISADFFQMKHTVTPSVPQTAPLPNNSAPSPAVATTIKALQAGNLPGTVTAYALRLHIAASLNSAQIGLARQGETYTINGQSPDGLWLNVSGPAGTGWADSSYITLKGAHAQLAILR